MVPRLQFMTRQEHHCMILQGHRHMTHQELLPMIHQELPPMILRALRHMLDMAEPGIQRSPTLQPDQMRILITVLMPSTRHRYVLRVVCCVLCCYLLSNV